MIINLMLPLIAQALEQVLTELSHQFNLKILQK